MPPIHQLLPGDIFPIVHKGENRVVYAAQLVETIKHLIGHHGPIPPEIMDMLRRAEELAKKAAADAMQALRNSCEALSLARKAYEMYKELDARVDALEQDVYVLKKLTNAVALLDRQVKWLTEEIEKLKNMELEIRSTTLGDGFIKYVLYKDGVATEGAILVPTKLSQLENDKGFVAEDDLADLKIKEGKYTGGNMTYHPTGTDKNISIPTKLEHIKNFENPSEGDMIIYQDGEWKVINIEDLAGDIYDLIENKITQKIEGMSLWIREEATATLKPKTDGDNVDTSGEIFSGN